MADTPRARAMRAKRLYENLRGLTFGMRNTYEISHDLKNESPEMQSEWIIAELALRQAQQVVKGLTDQWCSEYYKRNNEYKATLRR